jgi:hypothetical protein
MSVMTNWWLNDLAPVSGVLRVVFYTGLLALCVADSPSPLQAAKIIGGTEQALYTPVAALRLFGVRWVEPAVLSVVGKLTIAVWIAAAAGFAQPVTGILTFLGFAFLHAVNAGALGANHSTHSALYALLCLCFSVSHSFSADALLGISLVPAQSAFASGFAPLLLLVFLSYTLFAGGVSKLLNGGPRWFDGSALRFYLEQSAPIARWPFLSRVLVGSPALCRLMAWGSVLIELSAPVAIAVSPARVPLIALWVCLHVGILAVMMPAYWVQMWCYLLLVVPALTPHGAVPADVPGAAVFTAVGALACLVLVAVLVRQSEEWPFTAVPMYSNGRPAGEVVPPSRAELASLAARAHRGRHRSWQRAWVVEEVMEDIWVRPRGGGEGKQLFHLVHEHEVAKFARWSQYGKVVRATAIADVVAKSADRAELDAPGADYPAARLLNAVAPVVRRALPDPDRYERLELVCRTSCGGVVIAATALPAPEMRTP